MHIILTIEGAVFDDGAVVFNADKFVGITCFEVSDREGGQQLEYSTVLISILDYVPSTLPSTSRTWTESSRIIPNRDSLPGFIGGDGVC